jgi:hypothetical protein
VWTSPDPLWARLAGLGMSCVQWAAGALTGAVSHPPGPDDLLYQPCVEHEQRNTHDLEPCVCVDCIHLMLDHLQAGRRKVSAMMQGVSHQ